METQRPELVAWEHILAESTRRLGSTTTSPASASPLRLTRQPNQKHRPQVRRHAAMIPPAMSEAVAATCSGSSPWPLFAYGPAGTGKTCAALVLLDHAGGEYLTVASLCETLTQAQAGRLEWHHEGRGGVLWPEKWWTALALVPLVVLDEIGARDRVSDHHYEAVKRVLDERQGRPLVLISNLDLSGVERVYDDRLASRMAAGTVVKVDGKDRRLKV